MFTTETARIGRLKSKRGKSIDIALIEKLTPLDDIKSIRETFIGFQEHLYKKRAI